MQNKENRLKSTLK